MTFRALCARGYVRRAAASMLAEMQEEYLEVELFPAPRPQFEGHMIRVATNRNPPWYRRLAASIPPRGKQPSRRSSGIKRPCVLGALGAISQGRGRNTLYERIVMPAILTWRPRLGVA